MEYNTPNRVYFLLFLWFSALAFLILRISGAQDFEETTYNIIEPGQATASEERIHVAKPDFVRAVYLTANSAGRESYRSDIIASMKDSRINSVVIDIKDYSGFILYDSELKQLQDYKAIKRSMLDVKKVIEDFHDAGIYIIARQTIFQDPVLAKARPDLAIKTKNGNTWHDNAGLAWLNPKHEDIWQYNLAIAREATALGFDEINFDYIRYPSDGNIGNLNYELPAGQTKVDVMTSFFEYLKNSIGKETYISADLFGLVMDHTNDDYDLNIGQRLDVALANFDFVAPMMYPSHYPLYYLGFSNSAEHPGAVISHGLKISSSTARSLPGKIRPWLQAFNLRAVYTEDLIEQQIDAVEDIDTTEGWLLWNARNYYPTHIFKQ